MFSIQRTFLVWFHNSWWVELLSVGACKNQTLSRNRQTISVESCDEWFPYGAYLKRSDNRLNLTIFRSHRDDWEPENRIDYFIIILKLTSRHNSCSLFIVMSTRCLILCSASGWKGKASDWEIELKCFHLPFLPFNSC